MCNALKTDSPTDKFIRVLALIIAFMVIVNLPFRQIWMRKNGPKFFELVLCEDRLVFADF